jgi:hypothetical protein
MATPKITKAVDFGDWVELTIVSVDEAGVERDEPYLYVLRDDDPYGDAPFLRQQLQYLVDNGTIVIEQPA